MVPRSKRQLLAMPREVTRMRLHQPLQTGQRRQLAQKVYDPAPHQRLATGHPDLLDPDGDSGTGHPQQFLVAQDVVLPQLVHPPPAGMQ